MDHGSFKVSVGRMLATRPPHEDAVEALRCLMGFGHPTGQSWSFVKAYVADRPGFLGRKAIREWQGLTSSEIFSSADAFRQTLREPCPQCSTSGFVVANGDGQRETDFWVLCVLCARLTVIGRLEPAILPAPRPPFWASWTAPTRPTDIDVRDDDDDDD